MSQAKIAALVTCHIDLGMGNSSTTGTGSSASQRDIMYGWMANPAYANALWGEAFGYPSGGGGGGGFGGSGWGGWNNWGDNPFEVTTGEPNYSGPGFSGGPVQGPGNPPFYGNNPNMPPSGPAVGPPTPGNTPGWGGGGGAVGGGAGNPQVRSATPLDMGNAPPHVATQYGFWADTRGVPNQRATIGSNHTVVQFGPDGYISRILTQPTSSGNPNGQPQYNIPFDPYNPGAVSSPQPAGASTQSGGMSTMSQVPQAQPDEGGGERGRGAGGGTGGGTTPTTPPATPPGTDSGGRMPIEPVGRKRPLTKTLPFRQSGGPFVGNPNTGQSITDPRVPSGYQWGAGGASGNRTAAGSQLWTQFNQLADRNSNLDPAYVAALTQEGMNATRSGYADAREQLGRRVANTGNSAGYVSGLAQLGRMESNAYGQQSRQNQIALEAEKQRRRELGLQGIAGLYGGEGQYNLGILGALGNMMNSPISTRNRQRSVEGSNSSSFNLGLNF